MAAARSTGCGNSTVASATANTLCAPASSRACAQALLDAGAQSVFAVALATVEFPQPVDRAAAIAENEEEI